jgi:hypothetical protein
MKLENLLAALHSKLFVEICMSDTICTWTEVHPDTSNPRSWTRGQPNNNLRQKVVINVEGEPMRSCSVCSARNKGNAILLPTSCMSTLEHFGSLKRVREFGNLNGVLCTLTAKDKAAEPQ